jgi:hypothetical protein
MQQNKTTIGLSPRRKEGYEHMVPARIISPELILAHRFPPLRSAQCSVKGGRHAR